MKKILLSIVSLCSTIVPMSGQNYNSISARYSALANASVSLSDVWSTSQNQAALAFVKNFSGGASYQNSFLLKEFSVKSGACVLPLKSGAFGLFVSNFGYSLYSENKYALSFAKSFGENLSMGVSMDYLNIKIGENYGQRNTLVAEFGIISKPLKKLTIGAHIYNPTRTKMASYNNERIATIFRLGANYIFSDKVLLAVETAKDISETAVLKTGIEYNLVKQFYLRAGVSTHPTLSSFGFGMKLKYLQIDVSANYHQVLGFSPQFGLTYVQNKKQNSGDSAK